MLVIPKAKENPKKEVNEILTNNGIKVEKIETELIGNEAVVWITTAQEKKAKSVLSKKDIKSFTSDVVIVKLQDNLVNWQR